MKISEAARVTGMSVFTLRYYEKQGLLNLTASERLENNYRDYNEQSVKTLKAIANFRRLGFSIADIKAFRRAEEMEELTCQNLMAGIDSKIDRIKHELSQLLHSKEVLAEASKCCEGCFEQLSELN